MVVTHESALQTVRFGDSVTYVHIQADTEMVGEWHGDGLDIESRAAVHGRREHYVRRDRGVGHIMTSGAAVRVGKPAR